MTKAERTLAIIRENHLHAELFKVPFALIGQKVENPKRFEPRPTYKQEGLFTMEGKGGRS